MMNGFNIVPRFKPGARAVVFAGDCREMLREVPTGSIQLVVTSPPYNMCKGTGTSVIAALRHLRRGAGAELIRKYVELAKSRIQMPFCHFGPLTPGRGRGSLASQMSLAELKENVMALPEIERHDLVVWLNRLEQDYGEIPTEALAALAAEVWDQDDRHAAPTHPAR